MRNFEPYALSPGRFLLPREGIDLAKWAVIACDQHTSEPEYWDAVEEARAGAPSAVDIVYPEAWLSRGDGRIADINRSMRRYMESVLTREVEGFILIERETTDGVRRGLLGAVDLEKYDFAPDSQSAVRPTELTVSERVPPRVRIRADAPLEAGHVLLLADDEDDALLGPLLAASESLPTLYDFDLMLGGGHISGKLAGEKWYPAILDALGSLKARGGGLDFAVGDGNHSLAAAKACWTRIRETLSPEERRAHPARYAMVEAGNLRADSMRFHPIHRALFGPCEGIRQDFESWLQKRGMALSPCAEKDADFRLRGEPLRIERATYPLPVGVIQPFLDEWLSGRPDARIDYIHGDDTLSALAEGGATTIALRAMDKSALFPSVQRGPLPRKTFSMGEARDKRYYLETRMIR